VRIGDLIVGRKVALRGFEEKDITKLVQWRNDPSVNRHFFEYEPSTVEKQRRWLEAVSSRDDEKFFIISNLQGEAIGTVGLNGINYRSRHAEWGRFMIGDKRYLGKGYALEAMHLSIRYAFSHLNLHRLYLMVFEWNKRARSMYERFGFRREGILRDHVFRDGKYLDVVVYGLLVQEFRKRWTDPKKS
jgi:UDP-4-amino-4,6-dideoxy-N-acetyl-beta-L-altrosamine N-acetyltransferase